MKQVFIKEKLCGGDNSVKILRVISKFELDLYLMMCYPSESFNEIDKLLVRNQKCDNANGDANNDADGDIITMCRPYFTGDTKTINAQGIFPASLP